jgi:hypothetical protein
MTVTMRAMVVLLLLLLLLVLETGWVSLPQLLLLLVVVVLVLVLLRVVLAAMMMMKMNRESRCWHSRDNGRSSNSRPSGIERLEPLVWPGYIMMKMTMMVVVIMMMMIGRRRRQSRAQTAANSLKWMGRRRLKMGSQRKMWTVQRKRW